MGALMTGNKVLLKGDSRVSIVIEQFVRMLIECCDLPPTDIDFIHCEGSAMEKLVKNTKFR